MILLFADKWRAKKFDFNEDLGCKAWTFVSHGDQKPELHTVLEAKYVDRMNNKAWIYDESGQIKPVLSH